MKRLTALIAAAFLASTMIFAAPAKAYYPDPGDLLFRFVAGDWLFMLSVGYVDSPPEVAAAQMDPMEDCATGAPVVIQRKTSTGWVKAVRGTTNDRGKFKKQIPNDRAGKYRAKILAYTTPDGNSCFAGVGDPKRFDP